MKNNKGFTLVELLAVIVILAVILAIAVPSISNLLNSTKLNSFKASSDLLERATITYLSANNITVAPNTTSYILYTDMKTAGYIGKVSDPTNNSECTHSGVYVTNIDGNYTYKGALVCDNYIDIDAYNLVINNDFSNGTTRWGASNSTQSVSNQILSNTGNGVAASADANQSTTMPIVTGNKIYIRAKALVTNSNCQSITLRIIGSISGSSQQAAITNTPTANQWYPLSGIISASGQTGNIRVIIRNQYVDSATANGKVMKIDGTYGVYAFDLTSIYGAGNEPTATQIDAIMSNMGK